MRCIEIKDLGREDAKGHVYNRTIVGKDTETKPTQTFEGIALRDGDSFLAYGTSTTVYMYDETNDAWCAL